MPHGNAVPRPSGKPVNRSRERRGVQGCNPIRYRRHNRSSARHPTLRSQHVVKGPSTYLNTWNGRFKLHLRFLSNDRMAGAAIRDDRVNAI